MVSTGEVPEDDEENIRAKEQGILNLGEKYKKEGKAQELAELIKATRPFLSLISKAKGAKLVRSLVDFFLDLEAGTGIEVQLCKERLRELKKLDDKNLLVVLLLESKSYHALSNLPKIFVTTHSIITHTDNQNSIKLAHNNAYHSRTKHIDIRHHFVRDTLSHQNITLSYVPTQNMVADILTKPLPKLKHNRYLNALGLV
ncbi:unnamed protein product [Plutella xylostella]|uniref:(diamondback moth) hypothetical protein n=1 Tax=Plutella xylostella TaxID=51655 RepID=A0A8S4GA05_PLUXY|nr:unnamed protein product [Plutella xylostella]